MMRMMMMITTTTFTSNSLKKIVATTTTAINNSSSNSNVRLVSTMMIQQQQRRRRHELLQNWWIVITKPIQQQQQQRQQQRYFKNLYYYNKNNINIDGVVVNSRTLTNRATTRTRTTTTNGIRYYSVVNRHQQQQQQQQQQLPPLMLLHFQTNCSNRISCYFRYYSVPLRPQQLQQRQPQFLLSSSPPLTTTTTTTTTNSSNIITKRSSTTTAGAVSETTTTTTTTATTTLSNTKPITNNDDPYYHQHHIGRWLTIVSSMVIAMISIGGITRLTTSGLSMTSWSITGSLPPITQQQWHNEFHIYQQFPEYQQRKSMTLNEFKYIYFWEYFHRMMGRFIGIVYVVPYVYFTITKQIPPLYHPRFLFMGSLGLLQGYIGWWMVQSGLSQDRFDDKKEIRVKPLRLCTHLTMAVTTYSCLFYTTLDMYRYPYLVVSHPSTTIATAAGGAATTAASAVSSSVNTSAISMIMIRTMIRSSSIMIGMTLLTIMSGALVAGNDAGRAYNTFPKMNDQWIPSEYFGMDNNSDNSNDDDDDENNEFDDNKDNDNDTNNPKNTMVVGSPSYQFIKNRIEQQFHHIYDHTATVQFHHRLLATITAITGFTIATYGLLQQYPKLLLLYKAPTTSYETTKIANGMTPTPTTTTTTTTTNALKQMIPKVRLGLYGLGIAVVSQFNLGIITLLHHVPITLGAFHQIGSIIVLSTSIYLYHTLRTTRTLLLSSSSSLPTSAPVFKMSSTALPPVSSSTLSPTSMTVQNITGTTTAVSSTTAAINKRTITTTTAMPFNNQYYRHYNYYWHHCHPCNCNILNSVCRIPPPTATPVVMNPRLSRQQLQQPQQR